MACFGGSASSRYGGSAVRCAQCPPHLRFYPAEALIKMRLHELMPEPYAQLHQRYIKGRGACALAST